MSKTIIGGCAGTQYGCCADGTTSKNSDGSNCPTPTPTPTPTPVPTPTSVPTPTPAAKREYDQILSGDVKIKKLYNSNKEYKIKFSKKNISKVLVYQTWSSTSTALNSGREVKVMKAKYWVKVAFPKVENGSVPPDCNAIALYAPVTCQNGKKYGNSSLAGCAGQTNCTPYVPFTPTCVMELRDDEGKSKKHVFVINNAKVNKLGHVVFHVSSKDVDPNNTNKVIKKLKKIPTGKFHNARFDIDATPNSASPCNSGINSCYDKFKKSKFCNQSSLNEQCVCLKKNNGEYPESCDSCLDSYCE